MNIQSSVPLAPLTTFKIGGPARAYAEVVHADDAREAWSWAEERSWPVLILGGGSNVLISDTGFPGLVLHPANRGRRLVTTEGDRVTVEVGAGEWWDDVVAWAVEHGWWGIENLSHIPGCAGALAVQNVGAYGAEASQVVVAVSAYDFRTGVVRTLTAKECGFAYRRSIFNAGPDRGRYAILSVTLQLWSAPRPNLSYADLERAFAGRDAAMVALGDIRSAVIAIREAKFPFPREVRGGSAGSFFKAALLDVAAVARLRTTFAGSAEFLARLERFAARPDTQGNIKIPSAVLIDSAGLKGSRVGGAFLNPTQPVVILNDGSATAEDVLSLFTLVRQGVYAKTGIAIEPEPEFVGFAPERLRQAMALD